MSVIVFCYFKLLKFTMRKNRLNTVYANDIIQQERLAVSLEVGRIYFQSLDLHMQKSSLQTCKCKSRSVRFQCAEITYFEINRLYAYVKQIQQVDFMQRNTLLIKIQVQNRLFTKTQRKYF